MKRPFRERNPIPIGVVGLVVAATLFALSLNLDRIPVFGGTAYSAAFSEAAGLSQGDKVRIAGVEVGEVTRVDLEGGHVRVDFQVDDGVAFGDQSGARIKIGTILGQKYLALTPEGSGQWPAGEQIPLSRTQAPFDVIPAFEELATTVEEIDTDQLATAFDTLSRTFRNSPDEVRASLRGLERLSKTIASRDEQLRELLEHANNVSGVLAERNEEFTKLLRDGEKLLDEVRARRAVIHQVLVNTTQLSQQLSALVKENREELEPALQRLNNVIDILVRNERNLDRSIELMVPFIRMFTNTLGNGRWFDVYLQNLAPVPASVELPGLGTVPPDLQRRQSGEPSQDGGGGADDGSNGGNGGDGGSSPPADPPDGTRTPDPTGSPQPSDAPDDSGGLGSLLGVND